MGLMDFLFRGVRREAMAAVPSGAVQREGARGGGSGWPTAARPP